MGCGSNRVADKCSHADSGGVGGLTLRTLRYLPYELADSVNSVFSVNAMDSRMFSFSPVLWKARENVLQVRESTLQSTGKYFDEYRDMLSKAQEGYLKITGK